MTRKRLEEIQENVTWRLEQAQKILEGGENYDGADGARYIRALAKQTQELIDHIQSGEELT